MTHKFDPDLITKQTAAKAEIIASDLAGKTYAQAEAWVDSVTDLDSAKDRMKKMAKVLLAIVKHQDWSS